MKFVTFEHNGSEKIGVLCTDEERIFDLTTITGLQSRTMLDFITACTDSVLGLIRNSVEKGAANNFLPITDARVVSPIPRPLRNIICLGLNYLDHAMESQRAKDSDFKLPEAPVYFSKMATHTIGNGETIDSHPGVTNRLDYEVELAVIIGKEGSNIPKERAEEYIFGYTILNDVTARDLQRHHTQWFKGKSLDTFAPLGPYITHKSAIPFPVALKIKTSVNGEVRQKGNTSQLIYDIPHIISDLSRGLTLMPGDIIATGTPAGVGMGFNPPRFLKPGDIVTCTIEKIGTLVNKVK